MADQSLLQGSLSEMSRTILTDRVNAIWTELNQNAASWIAGQGHQQFETYRGQFREAAVLGTLCAHSQLDAIFAKWADSQRAYASIVRQKVLDGRKELTEEIELLEAEIARLQPKKLDFDRAALRFSQDNSPELAQAAAALASYAKEFRTHSAEKFRFEISLRNLDRGATDLDTLARMEGNAPLHYRILPSDEILKQLGEETYDGIPFEPFQIFVNGAITDHFTRAGLRPKVRAAVQDDGNGMHVQILAPDLSALIAMKDYVDALPPGASFTSTRARQSIPEDACAFSPRTLGGYFERGAEIFGLHVEKGGARHYTKQEGTVALSRGVFLDQILATLVQPEEGRVNEFYMTLAMQRLRENPIGYDGFTVQDVRNELDQIGYPLDNRGIGIGLARKADVYDVRAIEREDLRGTVYAFASVQPTDTQRAFVHRALGDCGLDSVSVVDIAAIATEKRYSISERVVRHLFDEAVEGGAYRLVKQDPYTVRTVQRPASASEVLKAAVHEPGAEGLF